MSTVFLIIPCLLLAGCTMSYTDPTLGADNPANPSAADGRPPKQSQTLDVTNVEPFAADTAPKPMKHSSHGMEDMPMPEQAQLKAAEPTSTQPAPGAAMTYACPMHPEVTSDKSDARCPKCGMKLKPTATPGDSK